MNQISNQCIESNGRWVQSKKIKCRSCVYMSYHHYDKIGKCLRMVHELQFLAQE
jgi:hypothetical protein